MKIIPMRSYGDFLTSREDGRQVYEAIKRDYLTSHPGIQFFCDFQGVKVLAPSFCDEVFGSWMEEFPNTLALDQSMNHALKAAFETVEETRRVRFRFCAPGAV
ncbi:MAG: STAS-like domain-containing protein [Elusimicrobia bacterium]|nr:STAS-like domain-containing protein [Elusimicrobiota bacterium]MBP9698605.1 STAS-like domain-containing protein [Elusimicrobiota bacterium]